MQIPYFGELNPLTYSAKPKSTGEWGTDILGQTQVEIQGNRRFMEAEKTWVCTDMGSGTKGGCQTLEEKK